MTADRTERQDELRNACRQAAIATSVVSAVVATCAAVLLMILGPLAAMRTPDFDASHATFFNAVTSISLI